MRTLMWFVISLVLFLPVGVYSQDATVTAELFFETTTPPKAIDLPVPQYPAEAKHAGLNGRLSIAIAVDNSGNVSTAVFASGPGPVCSAVTTADVLELRRLATEAAKLAKFEPVSDNDGGTIRTGTIIYTFQLPDKIAGDAEGETRYYTAQSTGMGDRQDGNSSSLGVLNGKATALPKPVYPAAARAVRASGSVGIQILIDEQGDVFSAEAVSGHPLLRAASQSAACGAKFSQTLLEGKPVKVMGVITYNFVP